MTLYAAGLVLAAVLMAAEAVLAVRAAVVRAPDRPDGCALLRDVVGS